MSTKLDKKIYFMGIAGTGMAAVAGLFQEAGATVVGSDQEIYPPMSTMLEELKINVWSPYAAGNIIAEEPDLVVVANALSRGNPEIEHVLSNNIAYTSFPKLMGEEILQQRDSIVVTGTHGKTTTTSLLTHMLEQLGEQPGFLIGGLPRNFPRSFRLGAGKPFVVEGDEYDTAFFDKGPKFLHYRPKFLILNNLEFDHADIYKNVEEIEAQFAKVIKLVAEPKHIIANVDDPGIARVLKSLGMETKVTRVSTLGKNQENTDVWLASSSPAKSSTGLPEWLAVFGSKSLGEIPVQTGLTGEHNMANIAMVLACLEAMKGVEALRSPLSAQRLGECLRSFLGVRRRLDMLGSIEGIDVFEDFAHHPTAIKTVINGFRKTYPHRRLLVAFEPRNATSRRNVFQKEFAASLALADLVFIGKCPVDQRIPADQRMNTEEMRGKIGNKARAFADNTELLEALVQEARPGDSILFMSSSSFSGIQHQLCTHLEKRART